MFDYIIAVIFWFLASWGALMFVGNFIDNIYVMILLFSMVAAVATVAYGKISGRMKTLENSIEELKEILKDKE